MGQGTVRLQSQENIAAHASSTARANATNHSMVGQIAAFANAVEANEMEAAAQALAAKANKAVTVNVVTEVARLANMELDEETAHAIAQRAAAIQAGESEGSQEAAASTN